MSNPPVKLVSSTVVEQGFISHGNLPSGGRGSITLQLDDNPDDCSSAAGKKLSWNVGMTLKAYQMSGDEPDSEKDKLLMEAKIRQEAVFELSGDDEASSLYWHMQALCRQKLLSRMRLLISETDFAQVPLPNSI